MLLIDPRGSSRLRASANIRGPMIADASANTRGAAGHPPVLAQARPELRRDLASRPAHQHRRNPSDIRKNRHRAANWHSCHYLPFGVTRLSYVWPLSGRPAVLFQQAGITPCSVVPSFPDRILRSPPRRRSRAVIPGIPTPAGETSID